VSGKKQPHNGRGRSFCFSPSQQISTGNLAGKTRNTEGKGGPFAGNFGQHSFFFPPLLLEGTNTPKKVIKRFQGYSQRLWGRTVLGNKFNYHDGGKMTEEELIKKLSIIVQKVVQKPISLRIETDLIGEGIIDSLDGMVLMLEIEQEFKKKLPEEVNLVSEGYYTIKKLVEFLRS